jgi:hypothetical protein
MQESPCAGYRWEEKIKRENVFFFRVSAVVSLPEVQSKTKDKILNKFNLKTRRASKKRSHMDKKSDTLAAAKRCLLVGKCVLGGNKEKTATQTKCLRKIRQTHTHTHVT